MSRWKRLPLLLPIFALFFLAPRVAHGCSCGPTPTVLTAFERADVVVITRAVSVEKTDKAAPPGRMSDGSNYVDGVRTTTMRVERVYKGHVKVGDELTFGQGGGADCIWTFNEKYVGRQFLFYLGEPGRGSKLWAGFSCGRSNGLEGAGDDLLYLNKLDKVRGKTRLSGRLNFDDDDDGRAEVANRLIRVSGGKKTYEVRTDASGVYEIYDLPPGTYAVEPEVPSGWKVNGFYLSYSPSVVGAEGDERRRAPTKISVAVEAGKHASLNLHFDIDNAIRGRIADAAGKPLNGVCLDLVPADGSKGKYLADCTERGGVFEVDEIPPGRYVILVNDDGKISSSEPFKPFYHPNASRREDAMVFEIGLGDFVEDVQVRVPAGEEIITVEGVFLYSDGKPVVDERVEFTAAGMKRDEYGDITGDVDGDAQATTDAQGRFSIKILKGLKGSLDGRMYTYVGEFENCPKLDRLIKQSGNSNGEVQTPAVEIKADENLSGVELKFPFPGCQKAKR